MALGARRVQYGSPASRVAVTKRVSQAKRVVGELSIIVVGVLIALWADGAVERSRERDALREHLVAMGAEITA